jgi:tetratricopeptide (TPR) repeat protein
VAANAADRGEVLRLKAESAAAGGRCEEALGLLGQARAANPQDARAALIAGKCQVQTGDYSAALASLNEAQRLAPSAEAQLYRGITKYHLKDMTGASEDLEQARAALPERAEPHLYIGLIALEAGDSATAAAALSRAGRVNPDAVEPIASYYEGMARESAGERTKAESALRRARDLGRGTVWEQQANTALARLEVGDTPPWKTSSPRELEVLDERTPRWWLSATAGFEYNDNVVLRGENVQTPSDIGSDGDERGVYWAEAGWEIIATDEWTVGILANYYGNAHDDLEDFDIHYPGASIWVDRRIAPNAVARVQYDFGYAFSGDAWVGDSEEFLIAHTWTPAIYQDWGAAGNTRFFSRIGLRDYLFDVSDVPDGVGVTGTPCAPARPVCGPVGLDEDEARDRDGFMVIAGFDHTLPLFGDSTVVRGGYHFHYYNAQGSEYSYTGHEILAGVRQQLPFDFALEIYGSYMWRPYANRSTFPDPTDVTGGLQYGLDSGDRHEETGLVDVSIERPVNDYISLSARYSYLNNSSNADVFDYDRHLVGVYATFRITP